jgi:hypothetical protein
MYFQASNPNKKGFLASNQDDDTFFGWRYPWVKRINRYHLSGRKPDGWVSSSLTIVRQAQAVDWEDREV